MTKKVQHVLQCDACGREMDKNTVISLGATLSVKTPDDDGMTCHPDKDLCDDCWPKVRIVVKQFIASFP